MSDSQPNGHRSYKRFAPQVWHEHKDTIRELFLEQGKTHVEVATTLKERYGLSVGARQLKRKTDEWGFFKNVPNKGMHKMVRSRQRGREQLGRPTKFFRKQRTGEFQVTAAKLDAHQKRFGLRPSPSRSQSSGLPSNIMYQTPSNYTQAPSATAVPRNSEEMELEFTNSTEQVFNGSYNSGMGSPLSPQQNRGESIQGTRSLDQLAREDVFKGNYQIAAQKWKYVAQKMPIARTGKSLAARVVDILSRVLIREREKYSNSNSDIRNETGICKVLTGVKRNGRFWGSVIVQQRALRLWEPILGQDHEKILLLRNQLFQARSRKMVDLDSDSRLVQPADTPDLPFEISQFAPSASWRDLLHLGDAPADRLLEKFQAMQSVSVMGLQIRMEINSLRWGRSNALYGVYYSFLNRFEEAELSFQVSHAYMAYETCLEIKLHRMLWYAEHKTRTSRWYEVGRLICQAHEVFMAAHTPSEFIIEHFPRRFKLLCLAVSMQTSVDKITNDTGDLNLSSPDCIQTGNDLSMSPCLDSLGNPQSSPAATASVLSPDRLFPPTPGGDNSRVDIEAWRRFVHFTPVATTPTQVASVD